jgi:hypothetical protein
VEVSGATKDTNNGTYEVATGGVVNTGAGLKFTSDLPTDDTGENTGIVVELLER